MTQPFRHPHLGRVDRSRTLSFRFGNQAFMGHPGDTLASALLANGVHEVARSVNLGRLTRPDTTASGHTVTSSSSGPDEPAWPRPTRRSPMVNA